MLGDKISGRSNTKSINKFVDKLIDKFKGNPTVTKDGKELFRIRRKGHPKGSKNASKTEYTTNTDPKTGKRLKDNKP